MATAAAMIFFFIWTSPPFRYLAQLHRGEHDPSFFHLFCEFQKVPFLPIDHGRIGIQIVAGGYVTLSIWGILYKTLPVCQTEQFLSLAVYKTDAHAVVDDLLPFHPAPLQCLILTLDAAMEQQAGMVDPRRNIISQAMETEMYLLQQQIQKLKSENENLKKENQKLKKALSKRELNLIKQL